MGKPNTTSYARQFVGRRDRSCRVLHEDGVEVLAVNEPTQLANFVAFCKAQGRSIYLRGHSSPHQHLLPTLFRGPSNDHRARWTAYKAFIRRLPGNVRGTRFRRNNFGAVLQHYGFNTPWLDVVDDLHVALWFALNARHSVDGGRVTYERAPSEHGRITLIATPRNVRRQDLRETQSSRNTRCHVQQGFSIAMQPDGAANYGREQDFARYVVGTVRIPNVDCWHLTGFMASQSYLFPCRTIDDTYHRLLAPDVADLLDEIEAANGLRHGVLGRAAVYAEPTPNRAI